MTWATEAELQRALAELNERYPGQEIEIIDTFDVAWSGWECDCQGALIVRDGMPDIVIVDAVGSDPRPGAEQIRERLAEYRRLIAETERVMAQYRGMVMRRLYEMAEEMERDDEE